MFIPEFVLGILATIGVEILLLFCSFIYNFFRFFSKKLLTNNKNYDIIKSQ